jgi:hypothetical protein
MDGGLSSSHAKRCDLLTIAEFERLLGFQAGARVILGEVERCRASPGGCALPFRCAARIAAPTNARANVVSHPRRLAGAQRPARVSSDGRLATVIPIEQARHTEFASDPDGNFVARRVLHLDIARARGDMLSNMLQYWTALLGTARVPNFGDIDPVRLAQFGLLGSLHVLNAANPDPGRMRFDLYGKKSPLDTGRIYTGLAVGDYPIRVYAQTFAADLDSVRQTAEPRYFRIRNRLSGVDYHFSRLALPFSSDGTHIDRVVIVVRPEPDNAIPVNGT